MKSAVSLTLSQEALLWLRAKTLREKSKSVSETVDRLVLRAREEERRTPRSVVGTVVICEDDPDLASADEAVRSMFEAGVAASKPRSPRSRARR